VFLKNNNTQNLKDIILVGGNEAVLNYIGNLITNHQPKDQQIEDFIKDDRFYMENRGYE